MRRSRRSSRSVPRKEKVQRRDHIPVLPDEVVSFLVTDPRGSYVDATVGDAGHSTRILERLSPPGRLFAFDCDPEAIRSSFKKLKGFRPRFRLKRSRFGELQGELDKIGLAAVDGFLYDLGLRTSALTDPQRGFSYSVEGPLDMRNDPDLSLTAEQVVNSYPQAELAEIFLSYGEERHSRRIAKNILRRRSRSPLKTTFDLRDAVLEVIPKNLAVKTLSRVFQALRLYINRDLEELRIALEVAVRFLKPGGRIVVVAYQSKEDHVVKELFRKFSGRCVCPPRLPECRCGKLKLLKVLTPKAVTPSPEEIKLNPSARSARLRAAERIVPR
jgi:16S rRNA (cytosine1402-N4)-methyltransferase